MKKAVERTITLMLLILVAFTSCNMDVQQMESGSVNEYIYPYLKFEKSSGSNTVSVTVMSGAKLEDLKIPGKVVIDGKEHMVGEFNGFENPEDAENLKTVVLPSSVEKVADDALKYAGRLESVKTESSNRNDTWTLPPEIRKDGYHFLGWFAGNQKIENGMMIDPEHPKAEPRWEKHEFNIRKIAPEYLVAKADCTHHAQYAYSCKCGEKGTETFYDEDSDLGDHMIEHVVAKDATCTEPGCLEHYRCTVCGKCFSDADGKNELEGFEVLIPALGHVFEENSWFVKDGKHYPVCDRCHEPVGEGEEHVVEWDSDSEYHWKRCKVCHHILSEKEKHDFVTVGDDTFCSICGMEKEKPGEESNQGGFEIHENRPPSGKLKAEYIGSGDWRVSFVKDKNSTEVADYTWIFQDQEMVGEEGSSVVVHASRPESHQVECLVRNEWGLGFATIMITGR